MKTQTLRFGNGCVETHLLPHAAERLHVLPRHSFTVTLQSLLMGQITSWLQDLLIKEVNHENGGLVEEAAAAISTQRGGGTLALCSSSFSDTSFLIRSPTRASASCRIEKDSFPPNHRKKLTFTQRPLFATRFMRNSSVELSQVSLLRRSTSVAGGASHPYPPSPPGGSGEEAIASPARTCLRPCGGWLPQRADCSQQTGSVVAPPHVSSSSERREGCSHHGESPGCASTADTDASVTDY